MERTTNHNRKKKPVRVLKDTLSGKILTRKKVSRYYPFLFFIAVLGIISIANNYYAERMHRQKKYVKERIEYYQTMSDIEETRTIDSIRQSNLVRRLANTGLKEAEGRVQKITITQEENI